MRRAYLFCVNALKHFIDKLLACDQSFIGTLHTPSLVIIYDVIFNHISYILSTWLHNNIIILFHHIKTCQICRIPLGFAHFA